MYVPELLCRLTRGGALVYVLSEKKAGEKRPRQRLIKVDFTESGELRETSLSLHSIGFAALGLAKAL